MLDPSRRPRLDLAQRDLVLFHSLASRIRLVHANRIAAISCACLQPGPGASAGLVLRRACAEHAEADAETCLCSLLLLRLGGCGHALPSTGLDEAEQMPLLGAARHDVGC